MKLAKGFVCTAILAVPLVAFGQNNPCMNIKWDAQFLEAHPRMPAACQSVVEKDGTKWAKLQGRVVSSGADGVQIDMHNVRGDSMGKATWRADPGDALMVGDKQTKVADLKSGDDLTFWYHEGAMSVAPALGSKQSLSEIGNGPNNPCMNIKWNSRFLDQHPLYPAACQTVVEKDGAKWAKLQGRVVSVTPGAVELDVHNVMGDSLGTATWRTSPDGTLMVGNQETKVTDLKKGDDLTVWYKESALTVAPRAGGTAALSEIRRP